MNSAAKLVLARSRTVREGEPVPSPCMSVCRMDAVSGFCEGCFRTLDEIAAWSRLDDADKRATWQLIAQRIAGARA
ncbi:DUF1289 domain-containing protein [Ramlibacter albus]